MPFYYDVCVKDRMTQNEVCVACLVDQAETRKIIRFLEQYCADFDIIAYPFNKKGGKHEKTD